MQITSEKATINASSETVFTFLSSAENIQKLLPSEQISDFKSDENGCSFKVQGGIVIPLLYVDKIPNTRINMKSGEKAPFNYTLTIVLDEKDQGCEGFIDFNADINLFMKMMVEKPLNGLFNHMTKKLQAQFA